MTLPVAQLFLVRPMRTEPIKVRLRQVKVLGTGMDGGHTYIWGKADYPPHGIVDAWAYFDFEHRPREEEFERSYAGGDVEIESSSWEYLPSTGLSLHNISWKHTDRDATSKV